MDNLELNLKQIQDQIDVLTKQLNDAQNQKLTAEVHLQNEQQEMEALENQLKEMTGLSNMNEIEAYIVNKTTELNNIMQDLTQVSNTVNSQYTFSENDVQILKGIVDKYNIPIGE
jgi:chromosome segregation ATPase